MGGYSCKGKCKHFKGAEKGCKNFMMEGKRWCSACNYKIDIDLWRCTCCGITYRIKSHGRNRDEIISLGLPNLAARTVKNYVIPHSKKYSYPQKNNGL